MTVVIPPPSVSVTELLALNAADLATNTDTGNALRLVELYGQYIRYAEDSKVWYTWEGDHWRIDVDGKRVLGLTQGVIRYMRERESEEYHDDALTRFQRFIMLTESEGSRMRMVKLASTDTRIRVRERDFDRDKWLLVVQNGTLDLRTGVLRQSLPEDMCTRRAAVSFDPDADCPLWKGHVGLVTGMDVVLASYLRRACGYALTGLIGEQKFWFLWGAGQNGKNVFVETLLGLMGEYGAVAPPALLTGGSGQHPTILADLRGARIIMADETGHERINDARLKMLTGSQQVKARFTGKDFFTYDSTMKLWILGNTKPSIKDRSDGIWRRMQLVPFTVKISEEKKKQNYEKMLEGEWAGILNWCLQGLKDWQQIEGLGTPGIVTDAVKAYREEEDEIGQWLEECCAPCVDGTLVPVAELYTSYRIWAEQQGVKKNDVMEKTPFSRELTGKDFGTGKISDTIKSRINGKQVRGRTGVRLLNPLPSWP